MCRRPSPPARSSAPTQCRVPDWMDRAQPLHSPGAPGLASRTEALRNQGIDLLRGLSIALVVMHHVDLRIRLKQTALAAILPARLLGALVHNGYEAVFVFFVISGFLITTNTLGR